MEKTLTKTICGELEFQLGYYTHLTAKTIGRSERGCEIALIYESISNHQTSVKYIIDLYFDVCRFDLLHTYEIRGMMDVETLTAINKAIDTTNHLLK